jgi:hypothetical protein
MTPNLQKTILAVLSFKKTTKKNDYTMTTTQSAMSATKKKRSGAQIQRGNAKARQRTSCKDAVERENRVLKRRRSSGF